MKALGKGNIIVETFVNGKWFDNHFRDGRFVLIIGRYIATGIKNNGLIHILVKIAEVHKEVQ